MRPSFSLEKGTFPIQSPMGNTAGILSPSTDVSSISGFATFPSSSPSHTSPTTSTFIPRSRSLKGIATRRSTLEKREDEPDASKGPPLGLTFPTAPPSPEYGILFPYPTGQDASPSSSSVKLQSHSISSEYISNTASPSPSSFSYSSLQKGSKVVGPAGWSASPPPNARHSISAFNASGTRMRLNSTHLTAGHSLTNENVLSAANLAAATSTPLRRRRMSSLSTCLQRPSTATRILQEVLATEKQLTEHYHAVNMRKTTHLWKSHILRLHNLRLQQHRRKAMIMADAEGARVTAEMTEGIVAAVLDRQTDIPSNGNRALIFPNQDVYEGNWKNGRMHGKGLLRRRALKDMYEGQWFLGQRSGKGMYHSATFQIFYTGSWMDNKRHGNGQLLELEGLYTGHFHDNQIHGYGEYVYRDGFTYKGEWVHGLFDGTGTYIHSNSIKYEGSWRHGYEHGKGTCSYANSGEMYSGDWCYGVRHGSGTYLTADFQYDGEWRYGTIKGKGVCHFADGSRYEGEWLNGQFHGFGTFTEPQSGVTYIGEFQYGKRNGRGEYTSPMMCYKGGWINDRKHGAGMAKVTGRGEFHGEWKKDHPEGYCTYTFWGGGMLFFKDGMCVAKSEVLRCRAVSGAVGNMRAITNNSHKDRRRSRQGSHFEETNVENKAAAKKKDIAPDSALYDVNTARRQNSLDRPFSGGTEAPVEEEREGEDVRDGESAGGDGQSSTRHSSSGSCVGPFGHPSRPRNFTHALHPSLVRTPLTVKTTSSAGFSFAADGSHRSPSRNPSLISGPFSQKRDSTGSNASNLPGGNSSLVQPPEENAVSPSLVLGGKKGFTTPSSESKSLLPLLVHDSQKK